MFDLSNIPLATKLLHQLTGIDCRSQERCVVSWPSDFYLPCPLSLILTFLHWFQICLPILCFSHLFFLMSTLHNLSLLLNFSPWSTLARPAPFPPFSELSFRISSLVCAARPLVLSLFLAKACSLHFAASDANCTWFKVLLWRQNKNKPISNSQTSVTFVSNTISANL